MREMIDSGLPWIGEIPKGWELRKLKSLVEMQTGFTPDTKKEEYYSDDGTDWITIGDLNGNKYIPTTTKKKISKQYIDEFNPQLVDEGSLLYSFKLSVGQTAYTDRPVYTNEAIASFSVKKDCFLDFIRFASYLIEYNANTNIYGAHILNQELIKNAYLICPPLDEQKRIAAFLDSEIEKVDELLGNVRKQIERLNRYKQSLVFETITRGVSRNPVLHESGVDYIGQINSLYSLTTIGSLFKIKKDILGREPEQVLSITQSGIRIKDIESNKGQIAASYAHYQIVNVGDFAMNHMDLITGGVDISQFEGVTSPDYRVFVLNDVTMNPYYFLRVFQSYYKNRTFFGFGQGVANLGRWRLPASNWSKIQIPVPPVDEQNVIVDFLDKKCSQIDQLIEIKQKKIEKLEQYKKSLIYEYVTGKKEVS